MNSTVRMRKKSEGRNRGKTEPCWLRLRKSILRKQPKVRGHLLSLDLVLTVGTLDAMKTEAEKREEQDAEILTAIAARRKLASDLELAKGIQYTEPLKTS